MASSASYIHKPEAPVAPFDLGIFSKVLLYKQQKFDQGADLIQNRINQLESQQVLGDAQRQYVSEKITNMVNSINGMGGMDFSERNTLNQTSSYIDSIAKDPIVTNAITNTRTIQKGMSYFEKLKADAASGKKGVYYNPANEYDYMEGVNDYLRRSKTDVSASYSDRPITPAVDVNKALMDAAKNVVASTYTTRDGENRYILKTGQVVTPERLYQTALTQVQTDPNLANQIRINSKYNYLQRDANGNLSPQQLSNLRTTYLQSNENKISSLQNELVELSKLKASTSDATSQGRIQGDIDRTSAELTNYMKNQESREVEIDTLLATSPEAAAQNVYTNKLLEGIVAAKAFRQEKVQFDQAAMFVDKMNMEQAKLAFDKDTQEKKFALEQADLALKAQKQEADIAKDAASNINGTGGIMTEATSLPTNVRKSSQETHYDQIRGTELEQANVQQDYYKYLYQFRGADGLVQKDGNKYIPTQRGQTLWADNMKALKDMRDGKKIPTPLDPQFIKYAIKHQELDLVKDQYQNNVIEINKQALNNKRKQLGMSDEDYNLFLKGKSLFDLAPEKEILTPNTGGAFTGSLMQNPYKKVKDYSQLEQNPENKKALDVFRKYNTKLVPDKDEVQRLYEAQSSQIIPRVHIPVGLKKADLDARAGALKEQIHGRGYYSLDGSEKPEKTRGGDFRQDQITYIGDFFGDLGEGAKPYVKAEISNGLSGEKQSSQTVYIDVDDTYASNFRTFAMNPNEAAKQQVLRTGNVTYDSASSDGRNIIQTKVVQNVDNPDTATVQVYLTHDEKGYRVTPYPVNINTTSNMNISQSIEFAKKFADQYSKFYKEALKIGKKPTPAAYIKILNGQ